MAIWFHGCDMGRGVVYAPNEEKARREVVLDARERKAKEGTEVTYNPELGFHGYVDTIAYRMDVEPVTLEDVDMLAVIRGVFMRNGTHSEAEEAVRLHLEERRNLAR